MPISGLVLTFDGDLNAMHPAISPLRRHPLIELGSPQGRRLPIVLDTPDKQTDQTVWSWLNQLPGIFHIDVAMVSFDEVPTPQPLTIRATEA